MTQESQLQVKIPSKNLVPEADKLIGPIYDEYKASTRRYVSSGNQMCVFTRRYTVDLELLRRRVANGSCNR